MAKTMVKLRAFLDAEAKRNAGGNGIKPIERVPIQIVVPRRELLYARLCGEKMLEILGILHSDFRHGNPI
jgi:hypothetical protein